jgi:murein DD-endopeptidase MepM/ murein hydrolase activator NlpD
MAARQLRRLIGLTAMAAATAAFAQAPDIAAVAPLTLEAPVQAPAAASAPLPKAVGYALLGPNAAPARGADVNGDGQADFANPTGKSPRGEDAYGSGAFGAVRTGHMHAGVDYVSEAGQQVFAPIAGFVTRVGYAYKDDHNFRYVEITNRLTGYTARVMYVGPEVQVGQTLALGQPIGYAQTLQRRYPRGITDHVHVEVARLNGRTVDAARLIPLHG